MSVSGNLNNEDPEPVTTARVFAAIVYVLLLEGCALLIVLPIAWGLGWLS